MVDPSIPYLLQETWCQHGQGICRTHKRCMQGGQTQQNPLQRGGYDRHAIPMDTAWSRCWHHMVITLPCAWLSHGSQNLQTLLEMQHMWCPCMCGVHV